MKFLRTVSTQRLLAIIAGLVIAVAGGTAIAFAAAGNGPVPPRESLAQALHQAAGPLPNGNPRPHHVHQPSDRLLRPPGDRSDPVRRQRSPVAVAEHA